MFRSIANALNALNGTSKRSKRKKRKDKEETDAGSGSKSDGAVSRSTRDAMNYLKKYSKKDKKGLDADSNAERGDTLTLEEYYWDLDNVDMTILLEIIYAKYNTEFLDKIHIILSKFEGEEILLLQQLCQRYKITYDDMREYISKTRIAVERKEKKAGNKSGSYSEAKRDMNGDDENGNIDEGSDNGIDIVDDASTVDGNAIARGITKANQSEGRSNYESEEENNRERKVLSRGANNPMMSVMSQLTNTLQKPKEETLKHVKPNQHTKPPPPPPLLSSQRPPPPPINIATAPVHTPIPTSEGEGVAVLNHDNPNPNPNTAYSYNPSPNPNPNPNQGSLYEQNKRDIESKRKDKEIEILRNELEFAKKKLEENNRETREMMKTLSLLSESTRQLSNSSLNGSSVYSRDLRLDGPESYTHLNSTYNRNDNTNNSNNNTNNSNMTTVISNEVMKSEIEIMKNELKETRKFLTKLANDVNFSTKKPLADVVTTRTGDSSYNTSDCNTPFASNPNPSPNPSPRAKEGRSVANLFNDNDSEATRKSVTVNNTAANSTSASDSNKKDSDNWCELYDPKSQKKYYYNTATRRSVWQIPTDAGATTSASSSSSRKASGAPVAPPRASTAAATPQSQHSNPATPYSTDRWDSQRSPQQTPMGFPPLKWGDNTNLSPIYRSNSPARGKSTNEKGRFAPVPAKAPKIVPKVEVHRTLYDKSWVAAVDPRILRKYYYNKLTKESVWVKPPGFEAAK